MNTTDKTTSNACDGQNVAKIDKRKKVYCARCNEESGGRGTSFWTHVHKYGPTTHKFKPTNVKP